MSDGLCSRQSLNDYDKAAPATIAIGPLRSKTSPRRAHQAKTMDGGHSPSSTESQQAARRWLTQVLPAMAPGEQLAGLYCMEKLPLFRSMSVAVRCPDDPKAAQASAEWLLNCKAAGVESLAEQMQLARQSSDPQVKRTVDELAAVREQMAHAVLDLQAGPKTEPRAASSGLSRRERDLARKLGLQTSAATRDGVWLRLDDARKAIPCHAVLIEIFRFPVIDFDSPAKPWPLKPPRYVAWTIPPFGAGEVRRIDLGDAATIDAAVARSRLAVLSYPQTIARFGVRKAAELVDQCTSQLADLVYKPLLPAIGDASTLLISPDGGLWLFPWEALCVGNGKYLVEQKRVSYLVTARSLLAAIPAATGSDAVLFSDPDYDAMPSGAANGTMNDWLAFAQRPLGSRANAGLLGGAKFLRLPGETELNDSLTTSLRDYLKSRPVVYQGDKAQEDAFKALHGPRILVLSTHGYFLPDQLFDKLPETDAGRRASATMNRVRLLGLVNMPVIPEPRSCLLRAGDGRPLQTGHYRSRDANDGILTGLEILGADLHGTDLVVLNACETGVGAVRDGEGTAGLHQAFQLAGARVVVATLWRIPAIPSNHILEGFFANLAKGQPTSSSLRNAELNAIAELRKTTGVAHPQRASFRDDRYSPRACRGG